MAVGFEDGEDPFEGHGGAVGAMAGEGVEDIGGCEDTGWGVGVLEKKGIKEVRALLLAKPEALAESSSR